MRKTTKLADEAIALLQAALARRGLTPVQVVNNADDGALPPHPSIDVVPYLHYGAVGLNALEGYSTAVFIHGYYIPDEVLAKAVFPHLPPTQRPKPRISASGGRRRISWTGTISDEDRRLAEVILFRLEGDPALQAFGRVRYTIAPRIVVMSIQHNIQRRIGRVTTVTNLASARAVLGLNDTIGEQHQHQIERLRVLLGQGLTLKAAAAALGMPYRSAKRLAATADFQLNPGRHGGESHAEPAEKGPNPLYVVYKVGLAPFPPGAKGSNPRNPQGVEAQGAKTL